MWKIIYAEDISFNVTIIKGETKGQLVNILTFAGNVMYGDYSALSSWECSHTQYINERA